MDDRVTAAEHAARSIEHVLNENSKYSRPVIPVQSEQVVEAKQAIEEVEEQMAELKVDHTFLPLDALDEVSRVLMHGAQKHGHWNWVHNPCDWTNLLAKAERHIFAFQKGDDLDPSSGRSHIAHAICDLLFLQSYILNQHGTDNRFIR
jgi:hypothetical protein